MARKKEGTDLNTILQSLKAKQFAPVYFLCGEEPYYIDAIAGYIEKHALDEPDKEFNQTVLYGNDIDALRLVAEAKRFPMMAERQVVIIKEAHHIKNLLGRAVEEDAPKEEKKEDKKLPPLAAYLENPQRSTVLVICYKYKTADKRTAVYKLLQKNAVYFESEKLYDNQVPDWISDFVKRKNYSINARASALLAEYLGNDLGKIANELGKLFLNLPVRQAGIPPKTEITETHIQNFIGISKEYNVFELQNALGKKEALKANRIVQHFASNPKDNPLVMTIGVLFSYFSKVLLYQSLPDKTQAASALRINPYFVRDYVTAANNYPFPKLKQVIHDLHEYDLRSKGIDNVSAGEGELLKELVYRILH